MSFCFTVLILIPVLLSFLLQHLSSVNFHLFSHVTVCYVGVTDQSGIVWSTFAVCSFKFLPALVPLLRCTAMHVGSPTGEVDAD